VVLVENEVAASDEVLIVLLEGGVVFVEKVLAACGDVGAVCDKLLDSFVEVCGLFLLLLLLCLVLALLFI